MMDFNSLTDGSLLALFFKIVILVMIGMFTIFTVIVFSHIRSLSKIVIVKDITGAPLIYTLATTLLLVSVSLFLIALVIL